MKRWNDYLSHYFNEWAPPGFRSFLTQSEARAGWKETCRVRKWKRGGYGGVDSSAMRLTGSLPCERWWSLSDPGAGNWLLMLPSSWNSNGLFILLTAGDGTKRINKEKKNPVSNTQPTKSYTSSLSFLLPFGSPAPSHGLPPLLQL